MPEEPILSQTEKKEKKKKSKKEKKRKRKDTTLDENSISAEEQQASDGGLKERDEKEERRASRKRERELKKKEKEELLTKVPTVDEHGISYTKIQRKRMLKRVKRGLPPVPTEQEERERLRNEAQLRREEEAEFAGLVYKKETEVEEEDEEEENSEERRDDEDQQGSDSEGEEEVSPLTKDQEEKKKEESNDSSPSKKRAKRSKPVPQDYVCQACKNKHKTPHWIYDCPDKVTVRGTNQKAKKLRGLHDPDSKKLFVSGLPFDVKPADVVGLFQACGKVAYCKLIKFGDTGRCNGQAYVSFDTDQAAAKALKLSGTIIDNFSEKESKKKNKKSESSKRKQLKLKVSKMQRRGGANKR